MGTRAGPPKMPGEQVARRTLPLKGNNLWGVNFALLLLVAFVASCAYVKHHSALVRSHGEDLAQGGNKIAHHDLANDAKTISKEHDKGLLHAQVHKDTRSMHVKVASKTMAASKPDDVPTQQKAEAPAAHAGGILPQIPIKYLPFVIVGFMLMVPLLTIAVLKGCWAMIDMFVPMQGAPKPNNYAQRKLQEVENAEMDVERAAV